MAQGTSAGVAIPKPVMVQQTWGDSLARAIETERARNFEKNMVDQQLEYQRNKDNVAQANWDKEFDLKKSQAKTQTELMQAQVVKMAKQNEMLTNDLENQVNTMNEKDAYVDTITKHAQNQMEKEERKRLLDQKIQDANQWFGGYDATRTLEESKREMMGDEGSFIDPVTDWFSYMGGGDQKEYQGVSDYGAEQSPMYTSQQEMLDNAIQMSGGRLSPDLYKTVMGQDFHTMNAINKMPNAQKTAWIQANLPKILMENNAVQQPQVPQPQVQQPQGAFSKAMQYALPMGIGRGW